MMHSVVRHVLAGLAVMGLMSCPKWLRADFSPNLRLESVGVEDVVLAFEPSGKDREYVVERRAEDGKWSSVGEVVSGVQAFTDRGLKPGAAYEYRLILVKEHETGVIEGDDDAEEFSVSLEGASQLTLITTDGGDGNGSDHAIWGTPVLLKKDGTRVLLSTLKPKSFRVGWEKPQKPRTIGIGEEKYPDSIWAHAWSEMVLDLGGEYVLFEAFVGVDENEDGEGSVSFKAKVATGRMSDVVSVKTQTLVRSPGDTKYYIDAASGDDADSGTSPKKAWKTLERVNGMEFAPGDSVLFKAGSRYSGQLKPHGSGKKGAPIIIDRYGGKKLPRVDGEGKFKAALHLDNVEYWTVRNLEVTNTGEKRQAGRRGAEISINDFGVAHDIRLDGLFIHDVNGSNVKSKGGGAGINWQNAGSKKVSYFDGLVIENCHLVRCDRNGITGWGYWKRQDWHPSLNVVIRRNLLEDIGGDGIVPIGTDGCLIEHNVIRGGRMRAKDYAAGIWPWACDNTLIQYNEVSGMKGTKDGQGFDSDYNCRNSVFQYNYSHDNDGGFILICDSGDRNYSIGNIGTIVRYNISQNDGARIFQFGGPTKDTTIHNNVFYTRKGLKVLGVFHNAWSGWSDDVKFYNNIFYADGKMKHRSGKSTNNFYSNNVFYGNHDDLPAGAGITKEDPMLVKPGSGGDGLDSLKGYQLKKGSPAIAAGRPMGKNCEKDFWGNSIPGPGKPLAIGAHQR